MVDTRLVPEVGDFRLFSWEALKRKYNLTKNGTDLRIVAPQPWKLPGPGYKSRPSSAVGP